MLTTNNQQPTTKIKPPQIIDGRPSYNDGNLPETQR